MRRRLRKLSQESINGWLIISSAFLLSFPKNRTLIQSTHPASTTSITLNDSQRVHSQYTPCSTFPTKSDGWVHAGQHGLFPLRGNVGIFNAASRADKTCMWAWTDILLICRSSGKSSFYTILLMSGLESLQIPSLYTRKGSKIVSHVSVPLL